MAGSSTWEIRLVFPSGWSTHPVVQRYNINIREALLTFSFCLSLTNAFYWFADFLPNWDFSLIFVILYIEITGERRTGGEGHNTPFCVFMSLKRQVGAARPKLLVCNKHIQRSYSQKTKSSGKRLKFSYF